MAALGSVARVLDDGLGLAKDARPDFLVQTQSIEAFHVFFGVGHEVFRDEDGGALVRRLLNHFLHGADAAFGETVVVAHHAVGEFDGTRADVHHIVEFDVVMVEQHNHRGNFEH